MAAKASTEGFSDVKKGDWYYEAVMTLKNNQRINGYSDGSFKPLIKVNRVEFLKFAQPNPRPANCNIGFSDVKNDWYTPYLCLALEKNIVKGYPDGSFRPSNTITLAEAAKIIVLNESLPTIPEKTWFGGYITTLRGINALPQSSSDPSSPLNRAELAFIIHQINRHKAHLQVLDQAPAKTVITDEKLQIIAKVNALRAKNNLPPLMIDEKLNQLTQNYTQYMAKVKKLTHYMDNGDGVEERMNDLGINFIYYGENLAKGQINEAAAFQSWVDSPPHLENMLNKNFKKIGVGKFGVHKSEKGYEKGFYWGITMTD